MGTGLYGAPGAVRVSDMGRDIWRNGRGCRAAFRLKTVAIAPDAKSGRFADAADA
jgi:hypothetical protein